MKHLFYVHSHITYLVSISTIRQLSLQHEDVAFIYGRNFRYSTEIDKSIPKVYLDDDLMSLADVPTHGGRLILLRKYRQMMRLDKIVSDISRGDRYTAYLPSTKNYLLGMLGTHRLCANLAFIEEGLLTYTGNFMKRTSIRISPAIAALKYVNHGYRSFVYLPYKFPAPLVVYCLNKDIQLKGTECSVTLVNPVHPSVPAEYRLSDSTIFVIDTLVEKGITSFNVFDKVVEKFINICISRNSSEVWLRFRPGLVPDPRLVRALDTSSIGLHIIPEHISLEALMLNSRDLHVFGFHSSLLLYAAFWGHHSYSFLKTVFLLDKDAKTYYEKHLQLPDVFFEKVEML